MLRVPEALFKSFSLIFSFPFRSLMVVEEWWQFSQIDSQDVGKFLLRIMAIRRICCGITAGAEALTSSSMFISLMQIWCKCLFYGGGVIVSFHLENWILFYGPLQTPIQNPFGFKIYIWAHKLLVDTRPIQRSSIIWNERLLISYTPPFYDLWTHEFEEERMEGEWVPFILKSLEESVPSNNLTEWEWVMRS